MSRGSLFQVVVACNGGVCWAYGNEDELKLLSAALVIFSQTLFYPTP